jgi:hypothetical protein
MSRCDAYDSRSLCLRLAGLRHKLAVIPAPTALPTESALRESCEAMTRHYLGDNYYRIHHHAPGLLIWPNAMTHTHISPHSYQS